MRKIDIDGLLALNSEEIEIVYRRLRGETVVKVASERQIPVSTLSNQRMPKILRMLGVKTWREVEEELEIPLRSMIPSVDALRRGWPEEFREKIEALREPHGIQEKPTQVTEPTTVSSPAESKSQSQSNVESASNTPSSQTSEPQQTGTTTTARVTPQTPPWLAMAIPFLLLCLLLIAGAGFLIFGLPGLLGQNSTPTSQTTQTPRTLVGPTSTIELSATVQVTNTGVPLPTDTLTPTLTPTPTETVTPMPTETQSTQGLGIGDELSNDSRTLRLREIRYNQGSTSVGQPVRIPIVFDFDFTNHSDQTLLLQVDQSDFKVKDNLGNEATCEYWNVSKTQPALEKNVNNGQTISLDVFCGKGDIPPQVTTYTLFVTGFPSLPDSTWEHRVVR
jgi:hypothetical protein